MKASPEVQAWLKQLETEEEKIGLRNKVLAGALGGGVLLLLLILWGVYRATFGAYAVIDDIRIEQHPVNPGRLQIKYNVVKPGKVYCRRTSGNVETNVLDYYDEPCEVDRPWSWGYRPGKNVDVTLWYRSGLARTSHETSFPTPQQADIVVLIDTTGSMDPSIGELKEKCVLFSERLTQQDLKPRFALIGFGDTQEGPWLDLHPFTTDVHQFRSDVAGIQRFDGGDFPESALDALEQALMLAYDDQAIRRVYLVTDAAPHEPTESGATAEEIAKRLQESRISLSIFSRPEYQQSYEKLLGETGKFREIENFGTLLSEGRILED